MWGQFYKLKQTSLSQKLSRDLEHRLTTKDFQCCKQFAFLRFVLTGFKYAWRKHKVLKSRTTNRLNGVVVRASASQSVDLGFIPLVKSYQKTLKIESIASLLGARHLWEVVENKPASSKHSDTIRFLLNGR